MGARGRDKRETKRNKSLLHLASFPTGRRRRRRRGRRKGRVQRRARLLALHLVLLNVNELVAQRLGRAHAAASLLAVARSGALESVAAGSGRGRRLDRGGFEGVVGGRWDGSIHDVVVGVRAVALFLQEVIDVLYSADVAGPCPLVLLLLFRVLVEGRGRRVRNNGTH